MSAEWVAYTLKHATHFLKRGDIGLPRPSREGQLMVVRPYWRLLPTAQSNNSLKSMNSAALTNLLGSGGKMYLEVYSRVRGSLAWSCWWPVCRRCEQQVWLQEGGCLQQSGCWWESARSREGSSPSHAGAPLCCEWRWPGAAMECCWQLAWVGEVDGLG